MLHTVRRLIALRRATPALRTGGEVKVLHAGYPFAYTRGGTDLIVVNPRRHAVTASISGLHGVRPLDVQGVRTTETGAAAEPFSYGIFTLDTR